MATYRVHAVMTTDLYLDVEADSIDEAMEIADEASGDEFIATPFGDWENVFAERIGD